MGEVQESFDLAAGGATPRERLERLIRAAFDIVRANLSFWRLTYQLRMQPSVLESLDEYVRAWPEAIRLQLEALLRAAGAPSPAVEARLLFASIDGAAQHYALDPDHYPLEEVAAALVQRFLPPTRAHAADQHGRRDHDPRRLGGPDHVPLPVPIPGCGPRPHALRG
jgi:hypothetical protein